MSQIIYDNKNQHHIDSLTTGNIYRVVFKMKKGSLILDDNGQQVYLENKYQREVNEERKNLIDRIIKQKTN
jgi:hypothetical protein